MLQISLYALLPKHLPTARSHKIQVLKQTAVGVKDSRQEHRLQLQGATVEYNGGGYQDYCAVLFLFIHRG